MLILLFWNSTWWCWWWCVCLCFDCSKCHDLTWGIEQVLICMSVTHVSYYSDLSCLHGIICYACQVMHSKIMPCKPPPFRDNKAVIKNRKSKKNLQNITQIRFYHYTYKTDTWNYKKVNIKITMLNPFIF
jgi:hypothetical protein